MVQNTKYIRDDFIIRLREDVHLIKEVYDPFHTNDYLEGKTAPVFFGSAINNFGVQELLDTFTEIAPSPAIREQVKELLIHLKTS